MNKVNFDSLKHIKAPQDWLDKAAVIPETAVQKRRDFPIYRIAAVASIVLVSVIGLLIFLFFGANGSTPVAIREGGTFATDSRSDVTVVSETTETGAPAETIAVLSTDADGNPVVVYQEPPASIENGTQPANDRTEPTVPRATEKPSETVSSTEYHYLPTEEPIPTSAPPTEPLTMQEPTEAQRPPGDCEIYGMFKPDTVSGSGYSVAEDQGVFCRLYDSSGNLVGDSPLYSPQREAAILTKYDDGTVLAYYNPADKGLYLTEDMYEYVFYDVHGNELYRDIKFVF